MMFQSEKRLAILWLIALTIVITTAFIALPVKINTQILDLLPLQEQNPIVVKSQNKLNKNISASIIWFSQAGTANDSYNKARDVKKALEQSLLFASASTQLPTNANDMPNTLQPFSFHLMTASDYQLLKKSPDDFLNMRLAMLYGITAMQYTSNLSHDPLFTLGNYINQFNNSSAQLFNDAAQFKHEGVYYTLILSTLNKNSNLKQQSQLAGLHASLTKNGVLASGLPVFSAYGAQSAEDEISTVGILSLLAIIALIIIVFKSPWPLLPTFIAISFGVITGAIMTALCFKEVHVITLVFGSSLMGITVDYAFHYFCDRFRTTKPSAIQSLRNVFPGISLGMLSSSMVYGTLILTPFPGLQQIGVFTVAGLIAAWLTVSLLFPLLSCAATKNTHPKWVANFAVKGKGLTTAQKLGLICGLLLLITAGFTQLNFHDDIRSLQTPKKILLEHDKKIRQISEQNIDSRYFIIFAKTAMAVMQKESELTQQLDQYVSDKTIAGYQALSSFYQTPAQQQQNIQLITEQLVNNQKLTTFLQQLSMPDDAIDKINQRITQASQTSLRFDTWVKTIPEPLQQLWLGCDEYGCQSIIHLEQADASLAMLEQPTDGILWVDPVTQINRILSRYRITAITYLLTAFMAIFVVLAISLNIKSALTVLSIPSLSILTSLAILSLLDISISIFHIFGLMLALGISLDYAVFQSLGKHKQSTILAIVLSLLTSLLAFGLLSISETAFIQAFGLSLSLGIGCAFCLSQVIFSTTPPEGAQDV